MTGPINKLSDTRVEAAVRAVRKAAESSPGKTVMLGDGGGLTLQISKTGAASWLHRYMRFGKATGLGLGPYPAVTLRAARAKAEDCRRLLAEGKDPLAEKREAAQIAREAAIREMTFDECAAEYISDHKDEWKNAKHLQQWENTLATYASPIIGTLPISRVTTSEVKRILDPIWSKKNETASRLRGRMESVIDWAAAHGLTTEKNPARWKGHLEHLLARTTGLKRAEKHHAALAYADVPGFVRELRKVDGISRWALEFLILTAARTSEVIRAEWTEIDSEKRVWVIPKERMKAGKEHRVPLVPQTCAILDVVRPFSPGKYVFSSGNSDKPISNMAMTMLLRRHDHKEVTVHGFRSSFRDYIAEMTTFDFFAAEAALAHGLKDKTSAAYARSDLFEKRIAMMEDWAKYCCSKTGER